MAAVVEDGENSLQYLSSAEPPQYLSPSPDLSRLAREASRHLYASLLPFCHKPKPQIDELLVDKSFDAEQIWCQIDLISRPLVSMLRREVRKIERDPPKVMTKTTPLEEEEVSGEDDEEEELDDDDEEEEKEEEGEEEEESEEEEEREGNGVEDEFFNLKGLEEFLEEEEREFGGVEGKKKVVEEEEDNDDDEKDEEGDQDGDEEGNEDDFEFGDLDGDEDEDSDGHPKYEDFFGVKNKRGNKKDGHRREKKSSKRNKSDNGSEEPNMDDDQEDESDVDIKEKGTLSTHEKELLKLQSKIEQMEKANLDPKSWTMQGEVTAAKRPKNSALEVDLEFEHNMKPPPVATEESTASLEDLIKKRIVEGHFDDVQRAPALPFKSPKELKELDENKSKKGLAEIYEEEYAQQTGLVSASISFSDAQKNEANNLFKRLCLKLDALSHFHFAPKPVIEDLSIQANVPALAMEEIAPVAVSDAAMLAPEEVFKGKGNIKEDTEFTQAERKRRRANKKRKHRAETAKREAKKLRQNSALSHSNDTGNEDS